MKQSEVDTDFGRELIEGLAEAVAHQQGQVALPTRIVHLMQPEEVRAIRKSVAKSPKEFERRFGVPARTIEGWEQGRQLDAAHRVLLRVIEMSPEVVEAALS